MKAPGIKDVRKTGCGTPLGGLTEFSNPHWVCQECPDMEKVLRAAGVYLLGAKGQKYWVQCDWVQKKFTEFRASCKKLEDVRVKFTTDDPSNNVYGWACGKGRPEGVLRGDSAREDGRGA